MPMMQSAAYTDVPTNDKWGPAVYFISDNLWVGGYADDPSNNYYPCQNSIPSVGSPCFLPNNGATRGHVSKMVVNAKVWEGASLQTPANPTFQDVPYGSTFYSYIETMSYYGWATGYRCGGPGEPCVSPGNRPYFRPSNPTSRGQFSKMLATSMNQIRLQLNPLVPTFSDVSLGSTFYTYVETVWSHFLILNNGYAYTTGTFRVYDDISRGDIAMALFQATPLERPFTHNGRYAGSNNWDGPNTNCSANAGGGQSTFLSGVQVGFSTDYGGYNKFVTIGREILFDSDAISFFNCSGNTNYKIAIVFHAFDNPQGSGNCQNGVYTGNAGDFFTNLPRPVRAVTKSACFFFVDHNESRIITDSPTSLNANSGEYFAQAEWNPSDSQHLGEINIDNYQLDQNSDKINGRTDNMQKFCYERGNDGTGYTGNRYGVFPCPSPND